MIRFVLGLAVLLLVLPARSDAPERVPNYGLIDLGGHVCHLRPQDLPLRVTSPDPACQATLEHAAQVWNAAGQEMGVGCFFEVVNQGPADLTVRWATRKLAPGVAAITRLDPSHRQMHLSQVALDASVKQMGDPERAAVVTHELGHVLGLNHSRSEDDIMSEYAHDQVRSVDEVTLTARDRSALAYLYRQTGFVPIVPRRAWKVAGTQTSPG